MTHAPVTLPRLLGTGSATALVISNMVGATIFGATGLMLGALGSPMLVLAAWGVGAVFAFAGALSYAELGINFPSSGCEYVYLTRAYGRAWGFMTGWVSFFAGFSAPIAATALIFAHYFTRVFPQTGGYELQFGPAAFPIQFGSEQILAAAVIAGCTILNLLRTAASRGRSERPDHGEDLRHSCVDRRRVSLRNREMGTFQLAGLPGLQPRRYLLNFSSSSYGCWSATAGGT